MSKSLVKTVATSMVGNLFEWYDYALFGYFASIIGQQFFPSEDKTVQLIAAFSAFAAGFLVRPLGGMIFGHIGDRMGRKKALVLSLLMMSIPTAIIGFLPSYEQIGVAASVLLVLMRMLQGISMGGNYGGSITFTSEHTDPRQRGLIGSFAVTSCLGGILLGSLTATLFSYLMTEENLASWGWRIPFILGIFICLIGSYMRRNVPESPEYLVAQQSGELTEQPIVEVFRSHKKTLTKVVLAVMLHDLSFYILFVYMATYFNDILGLPKGLSLAINSLNLFVVCIVTVLAAWLSDRIGRKIVLGGAAVMFIIGTIPLLTLANQSADVATVLTVQMILAIAVGGYFGPIPALMVESYPTAIRFSAVAITTNISGPLFGGTAPMVVAWLISTTGDPLIPAYYLTIGAAIAFIVLRTLKGSVPESYLLRRSVTENAFPQESL